MGREKGRIVQGIFSYVERFIPRLRELQWFTSA
ncbi:MAG: hypothetical protein CM15mP84_10980 [Cellvibrionales bacterium]|nr:MAG: hypothetical protein CM15mP84_10980 [Cellvibrionales bacterium]